MDHRDIEIFLTIVHAQNITSAADALFLAPTTVGARLKALEAELGFSLFNRKKGYKSVQLTEKGIAFIPYAEQWINLWNQSLLLRDSYEACQFSFGSSSTLLDFSSRYYKEFMNKHKELQFKISILDSDITYSLVQQGKIDIGLVMYPSRLNGVITEELFQEELVIAYAPYYQPETPEEVSIHTFPIEHQILFLWDHTFNEWYNVHIPYYNGQIVKVNSASIMKQLFDPGCSWAIVPLSLAKNLHASGLANYSYVKEHPPARSVFLIMNELKKNQPLIKEFYGLITKELFPLK